VAGGAPLGAPIPHMRVLLRLSRGRALARGWCPGRRRSPGPSLAAARQGRAARRGIVARERSGRITPCDDDRSPSAISDQPLIDSERVVEQRNLGIPQMARCLIQMRRYRCVQRDTELTGVMVLRASDQ
jgi:hypothetical protein